jgi:DNA-directed RNA polymerase subunit RPC12/RpoP
MSNENHKSTGEGKWYNREYTKAAFFEELLECYICEKIYYSRRPIKLSTLQRKSLHVCASCSHTMVCGICGESVTPKTALFIENLPESGGGLLCPRCRDRVFLSFPPSSRGMRNRLDGAAASVKNAFSKLFGKIFNIRFRFGAKRR